MKIKFWICLGILAMGAGLGWAKTAGPSACGECHAQEFQEWTPSLHAQAYTSPVFQKSWKEHGSKPDCLQCHTTGWKEGSASFAHGGVTCESCHGSMADNHPAAKMPIPVSSDMCRSCHVSTHAEWKLSAHGQKNIRCFDCHNAHGKGLRLDGGENLCGSCHTEKQQGFAHATHHKNGLRCNTCHFPRSAEGPDAIMGTGAPGHNLAVGPDVCARCHEETVHKSSRMADLRAKVSETQKHMAVAGIDNVFDLNEKAKELQWKLDRARSGAWLTGVLGLLAGLGVGWLGAWLAFRRHSRK